MIKTLTIIVTTLLTLSLSHCGNNENSENSANNSVESNATEVGNAGDPIAISFIQRGKYLRCHLRSWHKGVLKSEQLDTFYSVVDKTSVEVVEKPLYDANHNEVAALTVPESGNFVIKINRKRWLESLGPTPNQIWNLVLHEYLNAMQLDDTNYKLSSHLKTGTIPGSWEGMGECPRIRFRVVGCKSAGSNSNDLWIDIGKQKWGWPHKTNADCMKQHDYFLKKYSNNEFDKNIRIWKCMFNFIDRYVLYEMETIPMFEGFETVSSEQSFHSFDECFNEAKKLNEGS